MRRLEAGGAVERWNPPDACVVPRQSKMIFGADSEIKKVTYVCATHSEFFA